MHSLGKQFNLDHRRDFAIKDIVNRVENRHIDLSLGVNFLHTLGTIIAFGNHFHLHLRLLNRVAVTNEGAERVVAAVMRVASNEQVTQIDRIVDRTWCIAHGRNKAVHLLSGITHQDRLEVVAILQSMTDAGSNSIDILQHRSVFNAKHIFVSSSLNVVTGMELANQEVSFISVPPMVRYDKRC